MRQTAEKLVRLYSSGLDYTVIQFGGIEALTCDLEHGVSPVALTCDLEHGVSPEALTCDLEYGVSPEALTCDLEHGSHQKLSRVT